jgi:hypothetical protein
MASAPGDKGRAGQRDGGRRHGPTQEQRAGAPAKRGVGIVHVQQRRQLVRVDRLAVGGPDGERDRTGLGAGGTSQAHGRGRLGQAEGEALLEPE